MRQTCGPVQWGMGQTNLTQSKNTIMHEMFEKILHFNVAREQLDDGRVDTARQLMCFSRLMAGVHTFTVVAGSKGDPTVEETLIFICLQNLTS